jgi:Fur family transcriptional regulator, ferric uptake regulator
MAVLFLPFVSMIASTQTNHPLPGSTTADEIKARLEAACARLRASGMRITQPRIVILRMLMTQAQPASIEQIHASLSGHPHECDLVTVYRCLSAFGDIGLVRRSFAHNGTSLYQMADSGEASYHVFCKASKEVRALDAETSKQLAAALKKVEDVLVAQGYSEISHQLEFYANTVNAAPVASSRDSAALPKNRRTQNTAVKAL